MTDPIYWRLSSFYLFYYASVGALNPYWGLYLQSLGMSAVQIGILISLMQISRIFSPYLWGHLADKTGRGIGIVRFASFASCLIFAAALWETRYAGLVLILTGMSFFWTASMPIVEATTLNYLGPQTARYGRIRLWGSIGFILAVLGIGYILNYFPVTILVPLVLGILLAIGLTTLGLPQVPPPRRPGRPAGIASLLRRPEVAAFLLACFLMSVAHGAYYAFYSILLVAHGYAKSSVGWLWSIGVLCEIGVFLLMPRLMARFSLKHILLAAFGIAVLRFLIIGFAVDILALAILAQVAHAATFGAYHAAAIAVIHRYFRDANQARGQALFNSLAYGAGGAVGGLYAGFVWEHAGAGVTFSLAAVCALAGFGLILWRLPAHPDSDHAAS